MEPVSPAVAGVTRGVLTAPFRIHGEQQQLLAEVRAEVQRTVKRKQVRPLTFSFLYPAPLPYSTLRGVDMVKVPLNAWHSSLATFSWNMTAQSWSPSNVTRKTPGFLELSPGSLLSTTLPKRLKRGVHFCDPIYFQLLQCTLLSWALLYPAGHWVPPAR